MARRHGWQLPFHKFQVAAISVFFLLAIAFYAFFAPFLGKDVYEYVADGIYSFLALSVFILYIRCTAIDPADPGILIGYEESFLNGSVDGGKSLEEPCKTDVNGRERPIQHSSKISSIIASICCGFLVKEDCRKNEDIGQQQGDSDEALFCTLCNAEVGKNSKHCRSCDKCIDGFDHHCRWLNNCVGRKNYTTFLFLMAMSLAWLAVECAVGITVFVRCFTDKKTIEIQMAQKLGDGFSRAIFAVIVAVSTSLSLVASVPLGELFFFHLILIKKGITTYEYVVAMRTQGEPPGPALNEDHQSIPSSPHSTATTAISGSPLGLHYRGSLCALPPLSLDQQDEIIAHLGPDQIPSTVNPDDPAEKEKRQLRRPVRISALKLAKMDKNEAKEAAAKARASSSVLRPVSSRVHYDSDRLSNENVSIKGGFASAYTRELHTGAFKSTYPPSRASRDVNSTNPQTPSSMSSPSNTINSFNLTPEQRPSSTRHFNPVYRTSFSHSPMSVRSNDKMENTGAENLKINTRMTGNSRSPAHWDQEAGRFVSSQTFGPTRTSQTELLYSGPSIFFGGPILTDTTTRSSRDPGVANSLQGSAERGRRSGELPVFAPSDSRRF